MPNSIKLFWKHAQFVDDTQETREFPSLHHHHLCCRHHDENVAFAVFLLMFLLQQMVNAKEIIMTVNCIYNY